MTFPMILQQVVFYSGNMHVQFRVTLLKVYMRMGCCRPSNKTSQMTYLNVCRLDACMGPDSNLNASLSANDETLMIIQHPRCSAASLNSVYMHASYSVSHRSCSNSTAAHRVLGNLMQC